MWTYRRFFTYIVACGLVLGFVYFIRLQVTKIDRRPAPDFFPNVARYRTSRVCPTRALILVNSSPAGSRRRQVIRETWGHPSVTQPFDISIAFGVGASDNTDIQRSLDWEAEVFGDIFQSAAMDSEIKSGSKVMDVLKTTRSACAPLPEFVLKTEDDVFLNTLFFGEFLNNIETFSSSKTMWCLEWNRNLDRLGHNSTWIVLKTDNSYDSHPNDCIGTVYLMTGRAVNAMIRRHDVQSSATQLPEDVYMTGVLTKEAGITLSLLGPRFEYEDIDQIDVRKVAFASLRDSVEESTKQMWGFFAKDKLNESRRSDTGL